MTMTLVSTITVGSGGAFSIQFTGIPQNGKDLMVLLSTRTASQSIAANMKLTVNNAESGYNSLFLVANGALVVSGQSTSPVFYYANGNNSTGNTLSSTQVYFSNYASTGAKVWSVETTMEEMSNADTFRGIVANSGPAGAITSIQISPTTDFFVQPSVASLYIIS